MSYYSNTDDVRELARNVLTSDFPDTEIEEEQATFKEYIDLKTKSTWDASDSEFKVIQKIEQKYAAAEIIEHYGGADGHEIANKLREQADKLLQAILDDSSNLDVDTDQLEISRTEFETYPKNRDARISRGRLSAVGFNPATHDSNISSKYDL